MNFSFRALMPSRFKQLIRFGFNLISKAVMALVCTSPILSSAYYLFFSRRFDSEHLAVLEGRRVYAKSLAKIGDSSPLLRRNIHRIEKGLIMRPRRSAFAESFIGETVDCYIRAQQFPKFSASEIKWATDVMDEYFVVTGDSNSKSIRHARSIYNSRKFEPAPDETGAPKPWIPYARSASPAIEITFNELYRLFARRRSVRWYKKIPVPNELIEKTINAAALAPSACNRQPFRFIYSTDPITASRVAGCAGGTAGFADGLQAIVIVIGDLSAYQEERDRHLIYIDASLAAMQLMLAAETLGLSTCCINWPDVEQSESEIRGLIARPAHERIIMLISIGYADPEGGIPYSQKKQGDAIMSELPRS